MSATDSPNATDDKQPAKTIARYGRVDLLMIIAAAPHRVLSPSVIIVWLVVIAGLIVVGSGTTW